MCIVKGMKSVEMSKMFKQIISALLAKDIPFTIHTIAGRYALRSKDEIGCSAKWVLLDKPGEMSPVLNYFWRDGSYRPIEYDYYLGYIELIEGL